TALPPNPAPTIGSGEPVPDQAPGVGLVPSLFGSSRPGTVEAAVYQLWLDRTGFNWMIGLTIGISVVLFTSLFTNLYGLATATIATDGTLLYWLGQHDYRRGEQPWFYYLLLLPQYEFIAVLLGLAASVVIAVRSVRVGLGRIAPGSRFFFQLFLLAWFAGILGGLSWAGEKMPWLMTHITLPATLLAAALIGELIERWRAPSHRATDSRARALPEWSLSAAFLVVGVGWFLLAARLSYGEFVPSAAAGGWERAVSPWAAGRWWWLALPPLAALAIIGGGLLWRGARRTGLAVLLSLAVMLAGLQIHVAWRLVYEEGDVPRDMMVYTQTAPDVSRMMRELAVLSEELTGGAGLEIWYDNNQGVSWPLQWYLRHYPNRHMFGGSLSERPANVPVVIVGSHNNASVAPYVDGYTAQEYVLRWWFPETLYRDFAIAPELPPGRSAWQAGDDPRGPRQILASVGESLATLGTIEGQQNLFRLVMFRDLQEPIGRVTYTMYVRDDLIPLFNTIRY
ncbi:MAG: TIGR03663 family protein, partial [Chloroflexota bacterium]|nr:TIGR03663 family protein [Chloroflexota bacterium]